MSAWEVRHGDCLDLLSALEPESVDACVTDPPYGLSFMGKNWDHGVPGVPFWGAVFRVLKPGAHLLSFGGSRTYHRMACAVEDAGFEVRDQIMWLYGEGFPKSLNLPGGLGTALKPAHEPIVVARKPLIGTVAANVAAHGTGALNVDACRLQTNELTARNNKPGQNGVFNASGGPVAPSPFGRWPANVALDEEAARMLDEQSDTHGAGFARAGSDNPRLTAPSVWQGPPTTDTGTMHRFGDSCGAARFFYCAKADSRERDAGLTGAGRMVRRYGEQGQGPLAQQTPRTERPERNHHPTVKPVALMCWLVKLVTAPGGLVLDPFTGSGTTGMAALRSGFRFLGMEREAEYVEIARARIAGDAPLFNQAQP